MKILLGENGEFKATLKEELMQQDINNLLDENTELREEIALLKSQLQNNYMKDDQHVNREFMG